MGYLERYRNGEHERVWSELQALGPAVRREPDYSQALEVALETMRRVRRDCEQLVSRLQHLGYAFGIYPDGSHGYHPQGPLVPPSFRTLSDCAQLEDRAGSLPLSLKAFWQEVGSVDFVGRRPSWPDMLDPLVVVPPQTVLFDLDSEGAEFNDPQQFEAPLAPDDLHKDNISGGASYAIALPDSSADALFRYERHGLFFVPYLRMAILRWGGFPGLDRQSLAFEPLNNLVAELEPF